jgi:DNA-binding CsgD family transcriptional regulator
MSEQDADRDAIIALIHRNRIAIWMNDMETWENCFVHADYTSRWGYWKQGGIFFRRGWEEMRRRAQAGHPPANASFAHDTRVENLSLQIGIDMAWATFDQAYPVVDDPMGPGLSREARVFEKHEGEWKIAFIGILDGNAAPVGTATVRVDAEGQVLWQSPAAAAAIPESDDVAIRNNRLRFRDTRLDRKLREALTWAAGVDSVYMSTHASMPIVVEAGEGLATRIYWVIADAGTIVFSFGNLQISEDRLRLAASIYELSPGQQRVAALVAEGLSLAEIAERMQVTHNTARTHLKRIFEKTGVRSQTALVRVLLSAVSPV